MDVSNKHDATFHGATDAEITAVHARADLRRRRELGKMKKAELISLVIDREQTCARADHDLTPVIARLGGISAQLSHGTGQ